MAIDPEGVAASIRRLATLGKPDISVVEALRHVTEACVDLFGVTGSGIMLADEQNVPRYVAASDGPGRMLELTEGDTGQGPCTEAFVNNTVVASTDVTAESVGPTLLWRSVRIPYAPCWVCRYALAVSPSVLLTSFTTGRTSGRTMSVKPWPAIATWWNPLLPQPSPPTTPASWPRSCNTRWTTG